MKNNRELKKTERQLRFERDRTSLRENGYTERDCTFGMGQANLAMFFTILPVSAILIVLYIWLVRSVKISFAEWIVLAVGIIVSVPVHEFLHAIAWGMVNGGFCNVRLGFDCKTFTPYCACTAPMSRAKYLFGVLLPYIVLGIIPAVVCLVFAKLWLLLFSLCNIFMAGGDTAVAYFVVRRAGRGAILLDHPERTGFFAFTKN